MTFEQIKTFLVVAREGNFTRAAQSLYLSQPAVSQHVLALEKNLGVSLFDRKGRKLVLTTAGQRFLSFAQAVTTETESLMSDLRALDDPLQGVISLGAINAVGVYVLPTLIAEFQRAHPAVRVELKIGNTEQIAELLLAGSVDLAMLDIEIPPSTTRYFRRDRYDIEELVLIVPPEHRWSGRNDVPLDGLYGERLIMRERQSRSRAVLETELAKAGLDVERLEVTLELGSTEAIKQAVASGLGIGFVPSCTLLRELKWRVIGAARLADHPLYRNLWLYSPLRAGAPQRVKAFRDYLLGGLEAGSEAVEPAAPDT